MRHAWSTATTTGRRGGAVPRSSATDESQAVECSRRVDAQLPEQSGKSCPDVALSRDGGETWFKEFDEPALPDRSARRASSASHCPTLPATNRCWCSPTPRTPRENASGRVNFTVRVSTDDGKTWSAGRTIQPGPAAYSMSRC